MDIQLFVSDLDGTLLNEHSQVAPETAQAIQRAQQAGIRWLTATGRSWNTAAPLLEQAGISCDFVLLNGAELRSAKGELLMHPDTKALLERMLTWLAEDGEEIALRRVRNEIVKPRHREPNTPKF